MSTMQDSTTRLNFLNLPDSDRATFDRVLSFFAARGHAFEVTDGTHADLIVTTDDYSNIEEALNLQQHNLLLVVTNEKNCPHGDLQLQRPLLVTRVMRALEQATQRHKKPIAIETAPVVKQSNPNTSTNPQYTALVIDDSSAIRKQLEIELRASNIPSQSVESGEQALEVIDTQHFDLIFLDIMMPGIDGYETCSRIRSNPTYKKTPVIMLSGKTAPLDEVKGVIAGATTYLTKPVKHDQFQQVLQRIVRWLNEFR